MPPGTLAAVLADASIPALARAADAGYLNPLLARALNVPKVTLLDVTVLNHKPGRRCTLLYDIEVGDERRRVVGKYQRESRTALRQHERLHALNETPGVPPLPRALLATQDGLTLQRFVNGTELRELAGKGDLGPFAMAGEWLECLHRLPLIEGLSFKTRTHELAKVESWLTAVAVEPSLADDATALTTRMVELASTLPAVTPVMIHRDYYPANLIWDGTKVWGIDIDQIALGDPAVDVGSFIAQLEKLALRTTGRIDAYEAEREVFLGAYGLADTPSLPFFMSYSFAKLAAAEVQRRRPDWRDIAAAFLQRGQSLADSRPTYY